MQGFIVAGEWHLAGKEELTQNQGWAQSLQIYCADQMGCVQEGSSADGGTCPMPENCLHKGAVAVSYSHLQYRQRHSVSLWVGFMGELLK